MREKDSQVVSILTLSGSTRVKAERKCVGEIDTWGQFDQRSTSSFYACRSKKHKRYSQAHSLFCAFGIWIR